MTMRQLIFRGAQLELTSNNIITLTLALFGIAGSVVAWWTNRMWSMVTILQGQLTDLNVELARNYVPRAELQDTFNRMDGKLNEIRSLVIQLMSGK